jgi:protein ImuA
MSSAPVLHYLRRRLAALEARPAELAPLRSGVSALDERLGTVRADAMHEILPQAPRHAVAAQGFALGLASNAPASTIIWILQTSGRSEMGEPFGPGLSAWGLDPRDLILVRVSDAASLLAAGEEALRSGAAGAVIMSGWGEAKVHGLTASRRLMMAARSGSTLGLLVRANAAPAPSAAETRWSIASAPSTPLAANAPGRPAFRARLLRSRSGAPPGEWVMEWDRETRRFIAPSASGGLVSVPADRSVAEGATGRARAA